MGSRRLGTRWVEGGAVVGAAALLTLALTAVSAGAAPGQHTRTHVSGGISAASVPGSVVFGATPATTSETVSIVLEPQQLTQLESEVEHGVSNYLTTAQFAAEYGQTPAYIGQLESYLGQYGISTSVYPNDLDVKAQGTAGEFDAAFMVAQRQVRVPAVTGRHGHQSVRAQTVHALTGTPSLPSTLAQNVEAVFGLDNYGAFMSHVLHASLKGSNAGAATACAAEAGGPPAGCHTPADFAAQYGLDGLYAKGAEGQGETLGIVTLAALNTTAPTAFWHTVLHIETGNRTVTTVTVDGGPGAPTDTAGSGETDLDTEQSGALAPDANVVVYQAPNTTSGFIDAFFTAAASNVASSVSSSWGESETLLQEQAAAGNVPPGYAAAFNEPFLEMAMQGQSAFVSSGDTAAYDAKADPGTTNLSVDNPGDSPYVTSAGGTTLAWSGSLGTATSSVAVTVPAQRTWGWDYLWGPISTLLQAPLATVAKTYAVGSGGGYSVYFPTPSYQEGVPGASHFSADEYLTPTKHVTITKGLSEPTGWQFRPTPPVRHGNGTGRAEPDLAADADPYTGYLLYGPFTKTTGNVVSLAAGWGGTSFVAPQMNGSAAVIDSALGHRVGFFNPAIYSFAQGASSPFTPLDTSGTGNDDLYYTGTPGAIYNPGSGLGTPNVTALATDFATSFASNPTP